MRILHYTLGFSPYRSGGLVKYAQDIMDEEIKEGDSVSALFPGKINKLKHNMYIKNRCFDKLKKYELVNSFPLPLFGGIKNPKDFMKKTSCGIFKSFFLKVNPQIIHIHTLMGLPIEFLQVAQSMGIPTIFTTHDYFGLAPEPTFFYDNQSYDKNNTVENWARVSSLGMTTHRLRVFQSRMYPLLRFIKNIILRFDFPKGYVKKSSNVSMDPVDLKEYKKLKMYYMNMFKLINYFHFNSSLTKSIYEYNLPFKVNGSVIPITNRDIKIGRTVSKTISSKIRIAYIGPNKSYKGFYDYLSLIDKLDDSAYDFITYGYPPISGLGRVTQYGRYKSDELVDIYKDIDILIVPSRCKETFGFVVLEALSNNTEVFVSNNVGAKDLVPAKCVFSSMDDLMNKITCYKKTDVPDVKLFTLEEHVNGMRSLYKKICIK